VSRSPQPPDAPRAPEPPGNSDTRAAHVYRTKTETMVRALAKAVWSDAVVELDRSAIVARRVFIHGTEPPLRGSAVQVDAVADTEAGAWRNALTALRRIAKRKANAEARRAESARAQAAMHDAHAAAIVAALDGAPCRS